MLVYRRSLSVFRRNRQAQREGVRGATQTKTGRSTHTHTRTPHNLPLHCAEPIQTQTAADAMELAEQLLGPPQSDVAAPAAAAAAALPASPTALRMHDVGVAAAADDAAAAAAAGCGSVYGVNA